MLSEFSILNVSALDISSLKSDLLLPTFWVLEPRKDLLKKTRDV